ncbi:MAG: beta-ribofuranosylaminobenzene 5'-phosphate synthase [Proteobacteria bacterium]|nr:beta-ribofuranosylaminobenzene 5'-phosphate synthase [Pseudomonadota bacterium]
MKDKTLRIRTTSRLSFGLIDMNGEIGRIEGGLGLALENPCVELRARRAPTLSMSGATEVLASIQRKVEKVSAALHERYDIGGVELFIEQTIPDHVGLGSGTQLALAIAQALNLLYDLKLTTYQLSRLAQRGGTSGIGCASFDLGGFLCDGGHRFGGPGGKPGFAPSSASADFAPPPILFHSALPASWNVILAIPDAGRRTHGEEECELFRTRSPIPGPEAAQAARLALLKVLPAVKEEDLESFSSGLEAMQKLGWKRMQLERQNEVVHATLAEMHRLGLRGVGMSSWGPTLYGFSDAGVQSDQATVRALEAFGAARGGTRVIMTRPAVRGSSCTWE